MVLVTIVENQLMFGVISYILILGGAFGVAVGLLFGLRAVKLI